MMTSPDPLPLEALALEPDQLRFQIEDLQRKFDAAQRELHAKDETCRRLEQRFREFNAQIRDLEQRAGAFHREAVDAASELRQVEETLKVCDLARSQLSAALERQGSELSRWREQARALQARADESDAALRRREQALERVQHQYEEACRLLAGQSQSQAELERQRREFEDERARLLEAVSRERSSAEEVRREGIEALEEAREIERRRPR